MGFVFFEGNCRAYELFGTAFPQCPYIAGFGKGVISAPDCIAVLSGGGAEIEIKNALAVIFPSDAPFFGLPEGIQLISCGAGDKNAVSFSSRTAESITVSLNRAVRTVNGICEPLEFPVRTHISAGEFDYMAAFAAMVLLGGFE